MQKIAKDDFPAEMLQAVNDAARAFTYPIGIVVRDEYLFEAGFDDAAKRIVHHPVTKQGGTDSALYRFVDEKVRIGARHIAAKQ